MDGLSRWDLVLWVVVAYGVVVALVRLLLRRRTSFIRKLHHRFSMQSRGTAVAATTDDHGEVA
jgi:hypothetical protein